MGSAPPTRGCGFPILRLHLNPRRDGPRQPGLTRCLRRRRAKRRHRAAPSSIGGSTTREWSTSPTTPRACRRNTESRRRDLKEAHRESRRRAQYADQGRSLRRRGLRRAHGPGRSRGAARLRLALGARASFHRLCHVAVTDPAPELLRRPDQARHARHVRDRPALARPRARGRADRAARRDVGDAASSGSAAARPASSTRGSASRWRRRARASSRRRRSSSRR